MMDIATCPRCIGEGETDFGGHPCPACDGTGQRHVATECDECEVALLVPWSADHTLAPLLCSDCACVVNRIETARFAGEKG